MAPNIIEITPDQQERITNDIISKIFQRVSLPKSAIDKIIEGIDLKPIIQAVLNEIPAPKDGISGIKGEDGKDAEITDELISNITLSAIERLQEVYQHPKDGIAGIQGLKGDRGLPGRDGLQGQIGPVGLRGEQGKKGDKGEKGLQGLQGIRGKTGEKGDKGDIGKEGKPAIITDSVIEKVINVLDLSSHVTKKELDEVVKKLLQDLALGKHELPPRQYEGGGALGDQLLINEINRVLGGDDWQKTYPPSDLPNVIYVAPSNGNFTTIKDAVDSTDGVTKTTILVAPGIYSEDNPIQGKPEVTLKAYGGQNTVEIEASNANENLFDAVGTFFIEDITLKNVSGAGKYAVEMLSTGAVLLDNIIIENCSNGVHLNNSGGQITIRDLALQGTMTTGLFVEAGNLSESNVSVVGFAAIVTVINITGVSSIATLNGVQTFSPNVITGIYVQDQARVVTNISSFVGMQDGIVLEGGCTYRGNQISIFNASQDGFRINDVGANTQAALSGNVLDSTRYDINILSSTALVTGIGETSIDQLNFVAGAQLYGAIIDTKEGDEGFNIIGELHVGLPESGAESVMGEGDSYTRGMLVYTENTSNVFADVSDVARSASSSTFTFTGTDANNAIYIASSLSNETDSLTHFGIKESITTAAVIGTGEIVAEYWNGSSWTEFNACTSLSSPGYLKYAKEYFNRTGNYHVKYNPFITSDWAKNDPVSFGASYYWVRFRIATAITTAPVFEQFKLHTNRAEFNTDGTYESHGDARTYKKLVVDAVRPLEGNMQNASIYVDQNVGVGLENNRFTSAGDLLGVSFELPEDCDSSAPLIFVWKGKFATTGNVDFTIRRKIVQPGDAYTNSEPAASGETLTITTGTIAIASANTREDLRVDLDVSNAIPSRENGFGDEIWITLQYPTRGAGNFDYTKLSVNYLSDFNGRHVRQ